MSAEALEKPGLIMWSELQTLRALKANRGCVIVKKAPLQMKAEEKQGLLHVFQLRDAVLQ